MKYSVFFEKFKTATKNTWTVEEIDFSTDVTDLRARMKPAEQHLIKRLAAFLRPAIASSGIVLF
jgi:ribonucleoside-diphosphate reductase beta chain